MTEIKRRSDIDNLIQQLQDQCMMLGVAYDSTKERLFAKHILDAKKFGEFAELINQERTKFALNILKASVYIKYWKGACSGPMMIYKNYTDVYNQTKKLSDKQNDKVYHIPSDWII